jgi:predicted nucleic acid-binding protein
VAVLDAAVLVPAGLRDVLLSMADAGVFRPVWQTEIEAETRRNIVVVERRRDRARGRQRAGEDLEAMAAATVATMNRAFPDARLASRLWLPNVGQMLNDPKDRHVLAAAVGAGASFVVTSNLRDFPTASRPPGVTVVRPDTFAVTMLHADPGGVIEGLSRKVARHRHPPHTLDALADHLAGSDSLRRFAGELAETLQRERKRP